MKKVNIFDNDKIIKLRLDNDWEVILVDKRILFSYLTEFILNSKNLFYYASQKSSTTTLDKTKKYIESLIEKKLLDQELSSVLTSIGWSNKDIDIKNSVFQGDLAEYLMCILIDKFTDIRTIISKVSLKTSPNMPSFGNDNIFYDFGNEIIYYGESKFYDNLNNAVNQAIKSIDLHKGIEEISFIKSHTNSIKAENGEFRETIVEKLEYVDLNSVSIKSVIFIVNDDVYSKNEIESKLMGKAQNTDRLINDLENIILVILPILDKKEFLEYFKRSLN